MRESFKRDRNMSTWDRIYVIWCLQTIASVRLEHGTHVNTVSTTEKLGLVLDLQAD